MTEKTGNMRNAKILRPGNMIGILGGGQLGRMLALSAAHLGLKCHIYCPDDVSPALDVTRYHTIATYDDEDALIKFAQQCDVITCETENIPLHSMTVLSTHTPVYPEIKTLQIVQDRLLEKQFLKNLDIPTAPFYSISNQYDLSCALEKTGYPAILKTRRFGYDGKGQFVIHNASQISAALKSMQQQPAIVEGFIKHSKEISVLTARGQDGRIETYDIPENTHQNHILHRSHVPANISTALTSEAVNISATIVENLDYRGMIAIEMFVQNTDKSETLIINEIAPRVHNSGHWTMNGCVVSQFEQHIRAVAGWTLATPIRHSDIVMENIIGSQIGNWKNILDTPQTALYIYGKEKTRMERKMGHVNHLIPRRAE